MSDEVKQVRPADIEETRMKIAKKYNRSYNDRIKRERETLFTPLTTQDALPHLIEKSGGDSGGGEVCDDENSNLDSHDIGIGSNSSEPTTTTAVVGTSIDDDDEDDGGGGGIEEEENDRASKKAKPVRRKIEEIVRKPEPLKKNAKMRVKKNTIPITPSWLQPTAARGNSLKKDFIPYIPNITYEYWDDPNELCKRLRLLIASQNAGNTNHTQEINSIIEELSERGIIV